MKNKNVFEVSPIELFKYIVHKIWLVAIVTLIFASIGFLKFEKTSDESYTANVILYIVPKETNEDTSYDGQIVDESIQIITGNVFAKQIHANDKSINAKKLTKSLTVTKIDNTKMFNLVVSTDSKKESKKYMNAVIAHYTNEMMSKYHAERIDVINSENEKVIEPANNKKTLIKYTGLGFVLGLILVIILYIINKIKA